MTFAIESRGRARKHLWTVAVLSVLSPVLITLCLAIWWTPFPVSEAVALFEDVANAPPTNFLVPDTSYYRPFFHLTLMAIWRNAGSLSAKLTWIKLALHIVPALLLVTVFVSHLRPRTIVDAGAACVAAAVLIGSPGFRDNLEIPLSYTAIGMPLALTAWILVVRERRPWHGLAIVAITLLAIGFKEQGLVIVPVILVAWMMGAPGLRRGTAISLAAIAVAYVALRLTWKGKWPLFEQSLGLGFDLVEAQDAAVRFGAFPYWVYAYNGASTIANVLFAEPTGGLFWILRDMRHGVIYPWGVLLLCSSAALTLLIAWWGWRAVAAALRARAWSREAGTFVATLVALLACGALSFNYSRDRLGGMAVVFYALSAFFALRTAATTVSGAPRMRFIAGTLALVLIAGAWNMRTLATIEWTRRISVRNRLGWLAELPRRRAEFAERAVYLAIMDSMIEQGTTGDIARPRVYPHWVARLLDPRQ